MPPYVSQSGDVISTALSVGMPDHAFTDLTANFRLELGQIDKIYTVDNIDNSPKEKSRIYTVYDVIITNPNGATEIIPRCRALQPLFGGGINNWMEVLPTDPGPQARNFKVTKDLKRGHFVLIGFISGRKTAGVILGTMPHCNKATVKRRPTKDKGTYLEGEIQGLNYIIDNDGALSINFNGPRKDNGSLIDPSLGPTSIEIDKTGSIFISTNKEQSVEIDREEKTITVINGATSYKMEQTGSKVTIECDDLVVNTNKNINVSAKGDVNIVSASGINLAREDGGASEPFVLGNKFVEFMNELISAVSSITHLGNLGAPTSPPLNAGQISSMSSKLQSLLSGLIKGEK